jgi:hypothetical protein
MAESRRVKCSPEQVFAVLNDGWTYPLWVVGASRIRDVDDGWPALGTKLHHSFGVWPALIDDTTEVLKIEPGKVISPRSPNDPALLILELDREH